MAKIEAKAVISAQDKTGVVFDNIAKKIDQIGKSGKAAEAVDRMAKALERAKAQMAAIERYTGSRSSFDVARDKLRAAQAEAERVAVAMKSISSPNMKAAAEEMRRVQFAVDRASRAYETQKTAIMANRRALETMGVPINQAAAHQARLRTAVERTNAALEKQAIASERSHNRRLIVGGAAAYAGHLAAHRIGHGVRETLHTYREFDKERRFGKAVMGLTDEQQKPLVDQAIHMGATTKFNDIQVLEAQRELAARGLKKDQVMGLIQPASNLGMALDLRLPDAVKQMEGAIFGFKKDISTREAAIASARRTADVQVKAAKISGMTPEDIAHVYRYGATPSRLSGVSEETLLAFGGISKKANMRGDESGTAFRALMAAAQAPTQKAREAMLANGLNFKNYQKNPDHLAAQPFFENVAAQYGVNLNKKARAGIEGIFNDKGLIADPAKFTPAVMSLLKHTLGGKDAKSMKSIAGMANRFRSSSMEGVDTNALMADLMTKIPGNLQLANAIFGAKQGGRIATALGDPETFKHIIKELREGSEGYAQKIAEERMAGFDGAVSRFEGAIMNFKSALGSSLDNGGKGGFLTAGANALGGATQWAAEMQRKHPIRSLAVEGAAATAATVAGAAFTAKLLNGFGLGSSAVALDGAAAALTEAAAALGAKGALDAIPGGKAAAKASWGAGAMGLFSKWGRRGVAGAIIGVPAALTYDSNHGNEGRTWLRSHLGIDDPHEPAPWQPGGEWHRDKVGKSKLSFADRWPAELPPTMTYGTGVGGDKAVTVTGDLHGKAEVTVKLDGGSLIQATARATMQMIGSIGHGGNGPGSAGHSSPDAGAASSGQAGSP